MQATQALSGKSSSAITMSALQASWQAFDNIAHLRPIHTEADYDRTVKMMNALLDVTGDDEDHPLSGLLELAADLVSRYEQEHHPIEAAEPKNALRFLMDARGLKQEDLSSVVPQSNLSAILAGKRKISAAMAGKLGRFFGISPAIFVPR
jgi:HTH-type transcriptional regulator / antitoxin HigA